MKQKAINFSTHKLFSILLLLSLVFSNVHLREVLSVHAQASSISANASLNTSPTFTPADPSSMNSRTDVISYLGMTFTYPKNWDLQPLPYKNFGFRISSPDIVVDPIGRPSSGAYLGADVFEEDESNWSNFVSLHHDAETIDISGYQGVLLLMPLLKTMEWHIYAYGRHHIIWVVYAQNDQGLVSALQGIAQSTIFTGVYSPESELDAQIVSDLETSGLGEFPLLKLPFSNGPGKIINGYDDGNFHVGGDKYALDLCQGSNCATAQVNDIVIAPTDLTLRWSGTSNSQQTVNDFHIFEISSGSTEKLCLSMGHFRLTDSAFTVGKSLPRGAQIGRVVNYVPDIEHIHMGLHTVPINENCAGSTRTAVPYDQNNGGWSLDGVDYPIGTNHSGKAITSTIAPLCAVPHVPGTVQVGADASRSFPIQNVLADTTLIPSGCDDTGRNAYLAWNTFLGGTGIDTFPDMIVDNSGNMYITGESSASWGTPINPYPDTGDPSYSNVFVAKVNSQGILQWNTFLGSANGDAAGHIALDSSGNVFVSGLSYASWGNPINPYHGNINAPDFFLAKLNGNGEVQWNTFLDVYRAGDIAVDANGSIYVLENQNNAFSNTWMSVHVAKLDSNGSFLWRSSLDNTSSAGTGILIGQDGNIYVAGHSWNTWGDPISPFNGAGGQYNTDVFVAKLASNGAVQWHTFLGGPGLDFSYDIELDGNNRIYLAGTIGSARAFVAMLNNNGVLQWNTLLGNDGDQATGLALDNSGNIFVAGSSQSNWGEPINPFAGFYDMFVAKLTGNGDLQWHTFLGGESVDYGAGIALDQEQDLYLAGTSGGSWGVPIIPYVQYDDVFAAKLTIAPYVSNVTRVDASPTGAAAVKFAVAFSENVTDVNTNDFLLTTSGVTGANMTNVSGSGATYTVTVNTGSGNGTIRLDVVDDDSIKDVANNPLGGPGTGNGSYAAGQSYTIEKHIFNDVPETYWSWQYIERLYRAGVTSGCNTSPMMYCPMTTVTRDQMAIFLLRGKHGSSYTPPIPTGVFTDVPTNYWSAAWIEQLAAEGITSGCSVSPKLYCPGSAVTRDQMAVFLLRAKYGSSYTPPPATGVFQDVPTNYWSAAWIEQLAAEGITSGCSVSPKLYCPTAPVTRDQMAVFLVRNFSLP
jgi:hypothetical protein